MDDKNNKVAVERFVPKDTGLIEHVCLLLYTFVWLEIAYMNL